MQDQPKPKNHNVSPTSRPYQPIDCGYYDTLEVLAMRRQRCVIQYVDEQSQQQAVTAVIADVFARDGEEFVQLDNGSTIRLDRLLVVNNRPVPRNRN